MLNELILLVFSSIIKFETYSPKKVMGASSTVGPFELSTTSYESSRPVARDKERIAVSRMFAQPFAAILGVRCVGNKCVRISSRVIF